MRLLGRTQVLSQHSLLESLDIAKALGFDGVEICVERKDWSWVDFDDALIVSVRGRVEALELAPCSFSLHQDYIYDDRLFEETKRAIGVTRAIGAEVFVFSGTKRRTGDEAEWARMVARTKELVDLAARQEVVVAEEFEPGFIVGSTADLLRLFEEIPSPYLAANVDLGHLFLCDPDPLHSISQLGPKIVHCHIENMRTGVHDHLLPQEGDMDLLAYLGALSDVGFEGGLALDIYKYDYQQVAPQAVAYLRQLISLTEH